MEGLISVFFWECYIVLEPFWHRDEYIMEHSEYLIAVSDIIGDDAYSKEVIEITRMRV